MSPNTGGQDNMGQDKQGSQAGQQSRSQSTYWQQQFQNEPYYQQGRQFEDYEQAYNTGDRGRDQYGASGQSFDQAEDSLRGDYENSTRGHPNAMKWDEGGKQACRAAWDRAGTSQSSDSDMQAASQTGSTNTNRQ
jgi:hypothetical protein